MQNYILLIYPIILLGILFFGVKIADRGTVAQNCWSYLDSKNLQAVAAYGIILHHLVQMTTEYGEVNKGPITILSQMGILFTSIFFFYSGYGLMRSYEEKENYLEGFLSKRLGVILLPFVVTNLIYIIPNGIGHGRIYDLYSLLTSIWGLTLINTNAWFVVDLIILYLLFYFVFKKIKPEDRDTDVRKALRIMAALSFIMTIAGLLLGHDRSRLNGHWLMGEWWYNTIMLFPLGLYIGRYKNQVISFFSKKYKFFMPLSIIMFVAAFALEEYVRINFGYYCEDYVKRGYGEKALTLAAQLLVCFIFVLMLLLITMKLTFDNKLLRLMSKISFEVYLVQDLFIAGFWGNDIMPPAMIYATVIAESVIGALILKYITGNISEFIGDYKKTGFDEGKSPEAKAKQRKKLRIVKAFKPLVIALGIATVICFIKDTYDNTYMIAKQAQAERDEIAAASVGDTVYYGYFDTEYMTEGYERLEWIVLDKKEDKTLLISKCVLFGSYYNQKHAATDYETSDIRDTLINEGYYEVFTKYERKWVGTDDATGDKVFLLSMDQAKTLFEDDESRSALLTPMAERFGANEDGQDKHSWWWLKGEGKNIKAPIVESTGEVLDGARYVNVAFGGVRPAVWINSK